MAERRIGVAFFQIKFLQVARAQSVQGGFIQNARETVLMGWSFCKGGTKNHGFCRNMSSSAIPFPPGISGCRLLWQTSLCTRTQAQGQHGDVGKVLLLLSSRGFSWRRRGKKPNAGSLTQSSAAFGNFICRIVRGFQE